MEMASIHVLKVCCGVKCRGGERVIPTWPADAELYVACVIVPLQGRQCNNFCPSIFMEKALHPSQSERHQVQ